jgi:urea transporter
LINDASSLLDLFDSDSLSPNSPPPSPLSLLLDFLINTVLRSVSQVVFCDNSFSGVLILAALILDPVSRPTVPYGLSHVVISNLFCVLAFAGRRGDSVFLDNARHGVRGFCPFLVGQSMYFFLGRPSGVAGYLFTFLFAPLLTPLAQMFVDRAAKSVFNSGSFTLPFNVVMWIAIAQAKEGTGWGDETEHTTDVEPVEVNYLNSTFLGISQVFFSSSVLSGVLISISILLYSRVSFLSSILGSLLSLLYATAFSLGDPSSRSNGLWGYNGVLTSIALTGVVLVGPVNPRSFTVYLSGLLLTSTLQAVAVQAMEIPCGTAPFCFAVMLIAAAGGELGKVNVWYVVEGDKGNRPEVLLGKYWKLEWEEENEKEGGGENNNPQEDRGGERNMISSRSVGRFRQYQKWLRDIREGGDLGEESQHLVGKYE